VGARWGWRHRRAVRTRRVIHASARTSQPETDASENPDRVGPHREPPVVMSVGSAHADLLRRQHIVVGIDGSNAARHALAWAFAEAEQRGAELDVVTAWDFPYQWAQGFNTKRADDGDAFAQSAADEAATEVDEFLDGKPRPSWLHIHSVEGAAAPVLLRLARDADLLVVGSRGRGGFKDLLLGSVSTACVHHTPCPIAVIPDPATSELSATGLTP
jgi:nucleotide-binding universal stress UspA family protein